MFALDDHVLEKQNPRMAPLHTIPKEPSIVRGARRFKNMHPCNIADGKPMYNMKSPRRFQLDHLHFCQVS